MLLVLQICLQTELCALVGVWYSRYGAVCSLERGAPGFAIFVCEQSCVLLLERGTPGTGRVRLVSIMPLVCEPCLVVFFKVGYPYPLAAVAGAARSRQHLFAYKSLCLRKLEVAIAALS